MRVAIVHDWLYVIGGAECVLKEILRCYPGSDVFTLFDVLTTADRAWIGYEKSRTSFLQRVPWIAGMHRNLLPLMPYAVEQFDFSGYDLVISSSCAVAKGVITGPDQLHVAYVHSPMRYAWDLQHQYLRNTNALKRALARVLLHHIRVWDTTSSPRPNVIIANSAYVGRRIKKAFGREVQVVWPPVNVPPVARASTRLKHFLAAGRLVSYKNTRAIIEAFNVMPELALVVAGAGPEERQLRAIAGPNVTFAGSVTDEELRSLMATARALIYAAEEDFGIVPVEALSEGTPVIALGRGGAKEIVIVDGPGRTGMFFEEPSARHIAACVNAFLAREAEFTREACHSSAQRFSAERFRRQFKSLVDNEMEQMNRQIQISLARDRRSLREKVAGE